MQPLPAELHTFKVRAKAVLLDLDFIFPGDDEVTPKWIIVLSDNLIEGNIIFTLTTSQTGTYSGSFRHHITVKKVDEPCFEKDCIIEIERTHPVDVENILNKCKSGRILHKGFISDNLLRQIFNEIAECPTVYEYIKDGLGVYD
jgi:hypothetical protein